ncbi:hypothetical protein [Spirosoma sp.]|uniref:hypothetical protein n=1 Tax=Spirosoma sp. TaxID=1899569 RepID=UPI003B3A2D1F
MKNLVVTEMSLPVKLQRFGILNHLEANDVQFYIPDGCYSEQPVTSTFSMADLALAKQMVNQGKIKVVALNDRQMASVWTLKAGCCSRFLARTIYAVIYARSKGYTLVTEDHLLRVIAFQQFGISISTYESVSVGLLQEVISSGMSLNIDLIHDLV